MMLGVLAGDRVITPEVLAALRAHAEDCGRGCRYLWAVVLDVKQGQLPTREQWARIVATAEVEAAHSAAEAEDWVRKMANWVNDPVTRAQLDAREGFEEKHGRKEQADLFTSEEA